MSRSRRIPPLLAIATLVLLAALPGCSENHRVIAPRLHGSASNPVTDVVNAFGFAWERRDTATLDATLTNDFRFFLAIADSTGSLYADGSLDRERFFACATHILEGGGPRPAAEWVRLDFDSALAAAPDDRPGKTAPWHRIIHTSFDLTVHSGYETWRATGYARFYVVRGDSAAIPPSVDTRRFGPDSTRWWIERMEEEPSASTTWGQILALYD